MQGVQGLMYRSVLASFAASHSSTLFISSPPALVASLLSPNLGYRQGLGTCCIAWEALDLCLASFSKICRFSLKHHFLERASLATVVLEQLSFRLALVTVDYISPFYLHSFSQCLKPSSFVLLHIILCVSPSPLLKAPLRSGKTSLLFTLLFLAPRTISGTY